MSPRWVLFACDGSPSVGGGHVIRSLTLAGALAERGWFAAFLASPFVAGLLDAYDTLGVARFDVADQQPETLIGFMPGLHFDAVVIDHFASAAGMDRAFRQWADVTIAVDDLTDRPRDSDMVVDCNLGRRRSDYRWLGPPNAEFLLGPHHAPVRPAFADQRATTLAWRREGRPVERVLVSLGLTDVGGVTEQIVRAVRPVLGSASLDVVIGDGASSLPYLRRVAELDARVRLHKRVRDMASLMASADLAIGAGGSSTWERATLGLPTLTLILAGNQEPGTRRLAEAGAAVAIDTLEEGWLERVPAQLSRLMSDEGARTAMSEHAAALCDGMGARRTAARIDARVQSGGRQ